MKTKMISYFTYILYPIQAVERGHGECPICLTHLEDTPGQKTSSSQGGDHPPHHEDIRRQTLLLSCTHVYHVRCLEAFEELSLSKHKVCPVCRSGYQKRTL